MVASLSLSTLLRADLASKLSLLLLIAGDRLFILTHFRASLACAFSRHLAIASPGSAISRLGNLDTVAVPVSISYPFIASSYMHFESPLKIHLPSGTVAPCTRRSSVANPLQTNG